MWIAFKDTLREYWFNSKDVRCIYCSHFEDNFVVSIKEGMDLFFYYNSKYDRDKYLEQIKSLVSNESQLGVSI